MTRPRRFDLSSTQVIASVLATLTGAVAASYLGVGGTLFGAAVGSLASTMGTEIYKHYLGRSQDKLRQAAMVKTWATNHGQHNATNSRAANNSAASQASVASQAGQVGQVGQGSAVTREEAAARYGRYRAASAQNDEATQILPAQRASAQASAAPNSTAPNSTAPNSTAPNGTAPDTVTQASAAPHGNGALDRDHAQDSRTDDSSGRTAWLGQRRWLAYSGAAAACFAVVVAAITIFELGVGKPLEAVVWHRKASGTSVGDAVAGHNSSPTKGAPSPGTSASSQASTPGRASPSGPASVSPSALPSATSSATASATATPTPTAGGQLGTSPPATPAP